MLELDLDERSGSLQSLFLKKLFPGIFDFCTTIFRNPFNSHDNISVKEKKRKRLLMPEGKSVDQFMEIHSHNWENISL